MSIFPTSAVVLTILLAASPVSAATTTYTFAIQSEGTYNVRRSGRLTSDGNRWRIDYDSSEEVRAHDTIIGGGGDRRIALNHTNRTWYYLDSTLPTIFYPSLFDFYRGKQSSAEKLRINDAAPRTQSDDKTISFQYDAVSKVGGESIKSDVSGRIVIFTSAIQREAALLEVLRVPSTGIADIDAKLHDALQRAARTVGRSEITITRRFKGGAPMTQTIRIQIDTQDERSTRPADFTVPDGYQYQPPIIGSP